MKKKMRKSQEAMEAHIKLIDIFMGIKSMKMVIRSINRIITNLKMKNRL